MPTILKVIVWGLRAPTNLPFSTLKNEKSADSPPAALSEQHILEISQTSVPGAGAFGGVGDGEKLRSEDKVSLSGKPLFPPPFYSPGSFRDLSFTQPVGREVRKRFPNSLRGGQLWLGLGSPTESSGSRRKGSCKPGEDATEGRGRPEGRLPGRGRRIRGGGSVSGSWASRAPPGAGCGP